MERLSERIKNILKGVKFNFSKIKCFKGKINKEVAIIYLDIIKNEGF